jgi:hypothetical protein
VAKKKQKISEEISLPTALQRFARKKATAWLYFISCSFRAPLKLLCFPHFFFFSLPPNFVIPLVRGVTVKKRPNQTGSCNFWKIWPRLNQKLVQTKLVWFGQVWFFCFDLRQSYTSTV